MDWAGVILDGIAWRFVLMQLIRSGHNYIMKRMIFQWNINRENQLDKLKENGIIDLIIRGYSKLVFIFDLHESSSEV